MTFAKSEEANRFVRFAAVGAGGFVVDVAVLSIMVATYGGYYSGRLVSFLCAMTFTWWGNRRLTFSAVRAKNSLHFEWGRYAGANAAGFAVNYVAYVLLINAAPLIRDWPIIAVAGGTLSGLCINYLLSRRFVFAPSGTCAGKDDY